MRDIGLRIQRRRLTRYAVRPDPWWRRYWWIWPIGAAWALWATFISDHGFYQIWRLGHENTRAKVEVTRVRRQIVELDREMTDPTVRRELAEHLLREKNGMARPGEIIYWIQGDDDSAARKTPGP